MTDTSAQPPTLSDLSHEACILASLIEGLDVLNESGPVCYTDGQDVTSRRASNAMGPMIEVTIKKAWELTARIEALECAEKKARLLAK